MEPITIPIIINFFLDMASAKPRFYWTHKEKQFSTNCSHSLHVHPLLQLLNHIEEWKLLPFDIKVIYPPIKRTHG
jgi:hypothetical protein